MPFRVFDNRQVVYSRSNRFLDRHGNVVWFEICSIAVRSEFSCKELSVYSLDRTPQRVRQAERWLQRSDDVLKGSHMERGTLNPAWAEMVNQRFVMSAVAYGRYAAARPVPKNLLQINAYPTMPPE